MFKLGKISFISFLIMFFSASASATVINSILPSPTPGSWSNAYPGSPGSVSIVDLTGEGGDLETNVPAGTGAALLETTGDGSSRAEIEMTDDFGTVGQFIAGGTLSYDYYNVSGGDSATIAPAIKLEVLDVTDVSGDGYATFIFEPFYNGGVGAFDTWHNISIDGSNGNFWHTGIYGVGGAVYTMTLFDWLDGALGATFADATIFSISLGLGSGTPNQSGYVDNVLFSSGDIAMAADFELAAVPLPAALPLYATGLAIFGAVGWRRRRNKNI